MSIRRPDIALGVLHLTKDRHITPQLAFGSQQPTAAIITPPPVPAFEVLKEILTSGMIRGGTGYIKTGKPAVCFSEAPLSAIPHLLQRGGQNRYSYYGISISKKTAFGIGARPVIYLPDSEIGWVPHNEQWRVVRFEQGTVDHTDEREWRVLGNVDLHACNAGLYVLVKTLNEARQLISIQQQFRASVVGILPLDDILAMV